MGHREAYFGRSHPKLFARFPKSLLSALRNSCGKSRLKGGSFSLRSGSESWGLAIAVQPMAKAQNRMLPKHARTGVAHDNAGLLAAVLLITMDRAIGTGRFLLTKAAPFQPHAGIV